MNDTKPYPVNMNAIILPLQSLCGLTQEQFAAKLGVTVVTVNRWENYRTNRRLWRVGNWRTLLIEIS